MIFGQLKFCGGYICDPWASVLDGKKPELNGDLKISSSGFNLIGLTCAQVRMKEMTFRDVQVFCDDFPSVV